MRHRLLLPKRNRPKRIRNFFGKPLPCCWDDCWAHADERYVYVIPHDQPKHPGDTLTYVFCSDSHKTFWLSATIPGMKGKDLSGQRGPLGLIIP